MNIEERRKFVTDLSADFHAARSAGSQDRTVWMDLASRYQSIGANMNWAFCIGRAVVCLAETVAVETEEPIHAK